MMKIIGYCMVLLGFVGVFVFVVIAADQVHFFPHAVAALPQTEMVERNVAVTQMATLDRSWRQLCHGAQWGSVLMLVGVFLIGVGGRTRKQNEPQH